MPDQPQHRYYFLRFGTVGLSLVVRDDTGETPDKWPREGRRYFPAVAQLKPTQKSEHNKAPGPVFVDIMPPSWVEMGHLQGTPLPVSEEPPDSATVQIMESGKSGSADEPRVVGVKRPALVVP